MHTKQVTSNIREITVEIRDFNVMVDGQNFLISLLKIIFEHTTVLDKLQ